MTIDEMLKANAEARERNRAEREEAQIQYAHDPLEEADARGALSDTVIEDLLPALSELVAYVGRLRGGDRPSPTENLIHWQRGREALARAMARAKP